MSNKANSIRGEVSIRWPIGENELTERLAIQTSATNNSIMGSDKYTIEIPESCHSPIHEPQNEEENRGSPSNRSPRYNSQFDANRDQSFSSKNSPDIYRRRSSKSVQDGFTIVAVGASSRGLSLTPDADNSGDGCSMNVAQDVIQLNVIRGHPATTRDNDRIHNDIIPEVLDSRKDQDQHPEQSRLYSALFSLTGDWPIFICSIFLITWIFFIWGIVAIIGWDNAQISLSEPVSPPQESFLFMTVNYWPSCSSARGNTWRLVSSQFAHAGIQHIGGNTLAGLIYGAILECTHPYHWLITILTYQMGCIFGCLGHSYVFPFEGLLGCSTGVYALIGGTISHVILNKDSLSLKFHRGVLVALAFQGLYDTISYWAWYNPGIAYSGHCAAFFTGIFLVLSFGLLQKPLWKKILGLLGLSAFLVLTISLIVHYVQAWPPSMLPYNPTSHPYDRRSCCGELYSKVNSMFSIEDARGDYYCDGSTNTIFLKR